MVSLTRETAHPNNSALTVNKFGVARGTADRPELSDLLSLLLPAHAKQAVSRAIHMAGARGMKPPSWDTLTLAENPPVALWRIHEPPLATPQEIAARASAHIDTIVWRAAQERITSRSEQIALALPIAQRAALLEHTAGTTRTMRNAEAYEVHRAAWEAWGTTARHLRAILTALDARVPDLKLAAVPEKVIREMADRLAADAREAIPEEDRTTPDARRACCPLHHRRRLRARASTARQALASLLGTIGANGQPYADADTLARWRERQEAARAFGEANEVRCADGTAILLWDVMETSRKARIAALYAKMKGLDDLAHRRGMIGCFLTITLPPKHHPNPRHGRPYAGLPLEDVPTPQETDRALATLWQRLRARWAKAGLDPVGMVVREPHQDGCPHAHPLLYVENREQVAILDQHLRAMCPDPVKGRRVASKLVMIDRTKCSASSYIMKYLLKAMPAWEDAARLADGQDRDGDPDHLMHIQGVAAWASERRLRRFSWIGMHGLNTIWQRIHGMSEERGDFDEDEPPEGITRAWLAMRDQQWADALEHLGAIRADKRERPRLAYEEVENRYGEKVRRPVAITHGEHWRIPLRRGTCTIGEATAGTMAPERMRLTWIDPQEAYPPTNEEWVTVNVSCPRGLAVGGCDGEAGGRTGPPPPQVQTFTVKYRVGDTEILVAD